nr:hypothetical protein [Tanacetum cinerariifolium]
HNLVRGLPTKCFENNHTCTACLKGKQHKASLTDDFSRFTWTFFLTTNDETSGILKKFITKIENLKDLNVKIIRCDNGGEFRNKEMNDFCSQKWIKREFSNARTPQQNGVIERRNRTLIKAARTMVLVNKSHNKTPYELFNGRSPAIGFLKPFGCHVMILNTLDNLGKFEEKGDEVDAGTISTNISGFSSRKPQDHCSTKVPEGSVNSNPIASTSNPPADQMVTLTVETLIPTISLPVPTAYSTDSQEPSNILRGTTNSDESNGEEVDISNMERVITTSSTPTLRIHKDHPKSQIIGPVDTPIQTRNKSKEVGEQSFIATVHQKTDPALLQFCLFLCFLSQVEPKKISDALQDPSWVEAMQEELFQFKIQNEEGIDYDEVFAPVARIEDIRIFLAYASFMGFTAPRAWYGTLSKYLLENGFQRGTIDQTLFIRKQREDFILVQVYVDDIIFGSSNPYLCREFEPLMHDKFQMSVMGELTFFLGLQVLQKEDCIFLSQDRPDIMFAICACARHKVTPKECHLHAVKSIFRYLKGHPKLGLWYPKESPFDLVSFSDSDYGGAT